MPKTRKESPAELEKKFQKGAHVSVTTDKIAAEGVVCVAYDPKRTGKHIGIEINEFHPGCHSCDGACDEGYGLWAMSSEVHLLDS